MPVGDILDVALAAISGSANDENLPNKPTSEPGIKLLVSQTRAALKEQMLARQLDSEVDGSDADIDKATLNYATAVKSQGGLDMSYPEMEFHGKVSGVVRELVIPDDAPTPIKKK